MIITNRLDFDRVSNSSKQISAHLPFPYNADMPLSSPSPHLLRREHPPGQELTLCSEDRAEGQEHSCPCQLPRGPSHEVSLFTLAAGHGAPLPFIFCSLPSDQEQNIW